MNKITNPPTETVSKPVVKITNAQLIYFMGTPVLTGHTLNHPRLGEEDVRTSRVLRVETRNTIYELEEEYENQS